MTQCKGDWKAIVARKRNIQDQAIKDFLQTYNDGAGESICDLDHAELRDAIARGDFKAETVIVAYIHRYEGSFH